MSHAGGGASGTGARLAARLVALKGVAPEPVRHVIFRSTRRIDGTLIEGYTVVDKPAPLDATGLEAWLGQQTTSIDRLAVAVLVVREILDTRGLILQCTIERRRGSADGPFCGDPVRVDFAGAAGAVRLYRAHPDGRLAEVAASAESAAPRVRAPEQFAGEQKALLARFGDTIRILDAREPTLFEDMVGLSSIVHVRTLDGREIGCGIGWHGEMPFVLEADFPRFAAALELLEEDAAAVDAALAAHDLVRGGTRIDEKGIAIAARRRRGTELVLLRPAGGDVKMEPHAASREAAGPDQQRWIRYAESFEGLNVLDAWRDGSGDDLIVLSADASGQLWRHHIDIDGVETWRKADDDAAVGGLHREQLFPGTLEADDISPADVADPEQAASVQSVAEDSLLVRIEAYERAMSALRAARTALGGAPDVASHHVDELQDALDSLGAHMAAAAAQPDAAALARVEEWLRVELALIRCVIIVPPRARLLQREVIAAPSAMHDLLEAAQCLALRRPTAAVFHCMRIVEYGIGLLAGGAGLDDPVASGERNWDVIMRLLDSGGGALPLLDVVRRRWRGPTLVPAVKHTEEEAEQIYRAASAFIQALS